MSVAHGAAETACRSLLEVPNFVPSREIHTGWGSELSKPLPFGWLVCSALCCLSHSWIQLNDLRAHVWGWAMFPNWCVQCPALQNLFSRPVLPWLDLWSSRAVCGPSSWAFAWSENQVGGNWSFSFGSCAGVYCSNRRFHLVHTPRSFLAGSISLEKENK